MSDELIRNLTIDGFRAFEHFEMHDLGRVNLLVGKNNCGKSSVLEAIQIASAYGDPSALNLAMSRRGERLWDDDSSRGAWDISHLFHGHIAALGRKFRIYQQRSISDDQIDVRIVELDPSRMQRERLFPNHSLDDESGFLGLRINWIAGDYSESVDLPLTGGRAIPRRIVSNASFARSSQQSPTTLITTNALSPSEVVWLFDSIVLTSEEDQVLDALRTIEPTIERIAATSTRLRTNGNERTGIAIKMRGIRERIPIGSMGDGIWRMLGLSLALAKAANGILLIDEIDTGLHWTVMEKMWRLVYESATRLNVQVFATTHSRDCYESLAAIASADEQDEGDVTIQRIEQGKETAVTYTGNKIIVAAERDIEVR